MEKVKIEPGYWDSFVKTLFKLDFLSTLNIHNGKLYCQFAENAWIWSDLSGLVKNTNMSVLIDKNQLKELPIIKADNKTVKIIEKDDKFIFDDGAASVSLAKYPNTPIATQDDYKYKMIKIGETSTISAKDAKTMFKITKKKGTLDFIILEDELIGIRNQYATTYPIVKNTIKDILEKEPTAIYRSFSFDKLEGISAQLDLFKITNDPNWVLKESTWLYAEIVIDTIVTFQFAERLIPISKHNWAI